MSGISFKTAGTMIVVLIATFMLSACGPSLAPAPEQSFPPDATTSTVFNRTNSDRMSRGLPALTWDGRLYSLSSEWADYLASNRVFYHRDLAVAIDSPGFESFASLGENILVGPSTIDGHQMQNSWLSSPSHYANIVGNWDSIAVAISYGTDGNVRAVVNFGRHF